MFILLTGCSKQCKECWDVALIFDFKYHFAWFWANNGIARNELYFIFSWTWTSACLVIQIFFSYFCQAWFFKKSLKKWSKSRKLFYHVKFTFLSWTFLPINEKSFDSSFLQSLRDGLVCLESHIYFCAQSVIMTLGGGGNITNDVSKFRKTIEFQHS